jgi:hypothetical protein
LAKHKFPKIALGNPLPNCLFYTWHHNYFEDYHDFSK